MMIQEDVTPFAAFQVRVLLARQERSARGLARAVGMKQAAMQRRVSGKVAFTVDEIQAIAEVLGVEPAIFFPPVSRERAS